MKRQKSFAFDILKDIKFSFFANLNNVSKTLWNQHSNFAYCMNLFIQSAKLLHHETVCLSTEIFIFFIMTMKRRHLCQNVIYTEIVTTVVLEKL